MRYFLEYSLDGKILGQVCSNGVMEIDPDTTIEIQHQLDDESLFYVDVLTKEVLPKQDYTLDELPLPCNIMIEGVSYLVDSQPSFEFDTPGIYIVKVTPDSVQYLEKEFEYVIEA